MYARIKISDNSVTLSSVDITIDENYYTRIALTQAQIDEINALKAIDLRYDGTNFYEGAPIEEANAIKTEKYEEELKVIYTGLWHRALESSMGKTGTKEYLDSQREEYKMKYDVCKGNVTNVSMQESLEAEMTRYFPEALLDTVLASYGITIDSSWTQWDKFAQLVIFRYEYGESRYNAFTAFLTDFRAAVRTMIENAEWSRVFASFQLAYSIPMELDLTQAQSLYDQFKLI